MAWVDEVYGRGARPFTNDNRYRLSSQGVIAPRRVLAACALALTSVATPAHAATSLSVEAWSEVVLDRGARFGVDRAGLVATSVDGHAGVARGTLRLQPGVHTLVLQWNPKGTFSRSPGHVLRLDAKPCKRYVVVAHFPYATSTTTTTWQPLVRRIDDIIGCTPAAGVLEPPGAGPAGPRKPAYGNE